AGSCFFFFQAEDGIRDFHVTGVRRVLFRSADPPVWLRMGDQVRFRPIPADAWVEPVFSASSGLAPDGPIEVIAPGMQTTVQDLEIGRASCRERVQSWAGAGACESAGDGVEM